MNNRPTSENEVPAEVLGYCEWLTATLRRTAGASGVYLHGSGAMGGWTAATSDVDILAVVPGRLRRPEEVVEAILGGRAAPGTGLEMSIVWSPTLEVVSESPAFELHITTGSSEKVVFDTRGDPDLVMHYAVYRERGLAVAGASPDRVFPIVPREMLLRAFAREVEWGPEHAPSRYAALNACRAWAYATDGGLRSKIEGGRWALAREMEPGLVRAALAAQEGGPEPRDTEALGRLIVASCDALAAALGK